LLVNISNRFISGISLLIYEGPTLVAEINRDLDGFKNISEAVGADLAKN
jgi:hypothetical protein